MLLTLAKRLYTTLSLNITVSLYRTCIQAHPIVDH